LDLYPVKIGKIKNENTLTLNDTNFERTNQKILQQRG
jgi:hypothetical protein